MTERQAAQASQQRRDTARQGSEQTDERTEGKTDTGSLVGLILSLQDLSCTNPNCRRCTMYGSVEMACMKASQLRNGYSSKMDL